MTTPRRPAGWEQQPSPFHEGEQAVQERIGVRERVEQMGRRGIQGFVPAEAREFFEDLPFLVVGGADPTGALWASLLIGEPGFVQAPTARSLVVHAQPLPRDPLLVNLQVGAPLGLLGMELSTRRRNRVNGHVVRVAGDAFELGVDQSFGNCKKYIQSRVGVFAAPYGQAPPSALGAVLPPEALELLARADTAFIASSSRDAQLSGAQGLDVSHRGGRPGFIRTDREGDTTLLTMPDFVGNFMFNTLGNLEVNPRAGFLALDFDTGEVLSLTGTARVIWDGPAVAAFEGAQRLLEFRVQSGWLWRRILSHWSAPEPSPQLRRTGTWHTESR